MKQKLYAKLASLCDAYHTCIKTGNDFAAIHEDTINTLVNKYMPSGSGIDTGTKIDLDRSNGNKLVFTFSYHFMDENGYYDGWQDYTLIVTASLAFGFDMRITGKNRDDIKDYFYQTFEYPLNMEVE